MILTYISSNQIFISDQSEECNIMIYICSNNRGNILTVIFVTVLVWESDVINVLSSFSYVRNTVLNGIISSTSKSVI